MKQTLDHLRSNKPKARPERSVTLCLAPDLVGDVQALVDERAALVQVRRGAADPDTPSRPRRKGEGASPREKAIDAELAGLLDQIIEHEGEMRLRANWPDGKWQNWVDANPPREEGESGYDLDARVTQGICNAEALIAVLGEFAHEWDGAPMQPGDWDEIFVPVVGGGDKKSMASTIVSMYESRLDFPQWRSGLSGILSRSNASASEPTSASPNDDSTAGSPDSSTTATT